VGAVLAQVGSGHALMLLEALVREAKECSRKSVKAIVRSSSRKLFPMGSW
jgi:hypothetical protein